MGIDNVNGKMSLSPVVPREERLSNPQKTIEIIRRYDFAFRKRFGQNFLIDGHVLDRIVEAAGVTKDDFVLEIGPGIGTLTQYLAEAAHNVVSIEIDRDLIPILQETLAPYDNTAVISGDVLKTDLPAVIAQYGGGRPVKVVANLPYYITTPILMTLLENKIPAESITVMVQKEVADRMQAGPGTKDYGALSLTVQYYTHPHIEANVPPNCFMPRPKVGSAVISLDILKELPVDVPDPKGFIKMIRAAFGQRRKTLVNAVANSAETPYTKEDVAAALRAVGYSESVRGEALTLEQFAEVARVLQSKAV